MSSLAKEVHEMQERKATSKVRVKTWDELCEIGRSFTFDRDSGKVTGILAPENFYAVQEFTKNMKHLCGKKVDINMGGVIVPPSDFHPYCLSSWMYEELTTSTPEPPPKHNDHRPVYESLMEAIHERARFGFEKYGTHLKPHNGRNAINDALQESLDMNMYLMQKVVELEEQLESVKKICREIGGEE